MTKKICSKCKEDKHYDDFQKRLASNDGLTASCKSCLSERDKIRANRPERVRARKEYSKTEAGIASHKKSQEKWAKNNKEKIYQIKKKYREENRKKAYAHGVVSYMVRISEIEQSSCSECGSDCNIHAHHDDYDKPKEIRWLCVKCHCEWHRLNGPGANA